MWKKTLKITALVYDAMHTNSKSRPNGIPKIIESFHALHLTMVIIYKLGLLTTN